MKTVNPVPSVPRQHETTIRVRYQETDAQGHVHHGNYVNYFEIGRVEMLRNSGVTYKQFEEMGFMLVVVDLNCQYLKPAHYDDELILRTTIKRSKGVRIQHGYEVLRDGELLVQGETTVACVNHEGKVTPLPEWLRLN